MFRLSVKAPLLAGFLVLSGIVPQAGFAADIGHVNEVFKFAYGTAPGSADRAPLYRLAGVVANHTVETVTDGGLQIKFLDDTDLRMGSNSKLVIDEYVYDPGNPNQAGVFQMTAGALRFVTGSMAAANIRIETPTATIGIRGTDIEVTVSEGRTDLAVRSGSASLTSKSDGSTVTVPAGQKASVGTGSSGAITGTAPAKPMDRGLRNRGERRNSGSPRKDKTDTGGRQLQLR